MILKKKKERLKIEIPDSLKMEFNLLQNKRKENEQKDLHNSDLRFSIPIDFSTLNTAVKEIKKTKLSPSFRDILFKYIDESGMTDPEVYKKAHIDKRTFSKIRKNENQFISKNTIICLALALQLNIEKTNTLLSANHYTLGDNDYFSIAIKWCIKNNIYDIEQVNDILYACDLNLLTK